MSGTSNVLPRVDAALAVSTNSKAIHPKTRASIARTGPREPVTATDGKATASQGNDSMEANFEGRVHSAGRATVDETKSSGGGHDPAGADFNEVLNKKINHKVENTAENQETKGVGAEQMPAEEMAIHPFVHVSAEKEGASGLATAQGNANTSVNTNQNAPVPVQISVPMQAQTQGQGAESAGQTGDSDGKTLFQKVHVNNPEISAPEAAVSGSGGENSDAKTMIAAAESPVVQTGGREHPAMASEQGVQKAAENSQAVKVDADGQMVAEPAGKEIAAAAVANKAGKEVLAPVIAEQTGKDIKGLTEVQKPIETGQAGKADMAADMPKVSSLDQTAQNQGQGSGQTGGSDTENTGFSSDKSNFSAEKAVEDKSSAFEIPDVEMPKEGQQAAVGAVKVVESSGSVNAVSGVQSSARDSGGVVDVTAMKPIDQIIQQLNVVDSTVSARRIQMTLTPDDLGTVRITLRQVEGEMVGMVEVQKDQTRREVEEAMPQLVSAMQQNGLAVRKVEVLQWNTPDQQTGKDSDTNGFTLAQEREFSQQSNRQGSSESSGFGQRSGTGQTGRQGAIPMKEVAYSDPGQVQKGLNFLV